jgi:hypothetical protein
LCPEGNPLGGLANRLVREQARSYDAPSFAIKVSSR